MLDKPNNPLNFWQELKRRKVLRVITVYAAVAFVILQLAEILVPSLGLPDWTIKFILVVLFVGFIIAIILSWIYDIHPEGGFVKTEPAHEITEKVPEKSSTVNTWKIATYISFVVIIGLIIFNIFGRRGKVEDLAILDKSIAVLPFKSLSDDPEKQYLADGVMDAILLHLSKIEDLRVMDRTSVEQYRGADKPSATICQELDVTYLLEGSFQKYGDQARLIVQLIHPGLKDHIWAQEYDREWKDIFTVQSEIAQMVAEEIKAIITPEEKQRIEKKPTTSLTAYDFYQRGREEHEIGWSAWYSSDNVNIEALEKAEDLYYKALEYDSAFARAYTGLAWIYWNKHLRETLLSENVLDSMLILTDIALSFDSQLAEAYVIKGYYYEQHNNKEQALIEYDKAIKYNPNEWMAYIRKGLLFAWGDVIKSLDNLYKAASLHRGIFLPVIYRGISSLYASAGFYEKSKHYIDEAFKLDNDSAAYYQRILLNEDFFGNFEKVLEYCDKSLKIDSSNYSGLFYSGLAHRALGQHKESLESFKKLQKRAGAADSLFLLGNSLLIGYAYLMNGYNDEAQHYLQRGLEYHTQFIEQGRHILQNVTDLYALAAGYTVLGDTERALDNLDALTQIDGIPLWVITKTSVDPIFENIWDEPEFKKIMKVLDDNYQAQHERVKQWIEENAMM